MQIQSANPVSSNSLYPVQKTADKPDIAESSKTTESDDQTRRTDNTAISSQSGVELGDQEKQELKQLQQRDQEVRTHEAAHKAAAGTLAKGDAAFSYEQGPDGKRYAIGGEVSIDTSPVANDPQATLSKANQIRAAALAPAQPSSQDYSVAAEAVVMAAEARSDIAAERQEKYHSEFEKNDE